MRDADLEFLLSQDISAPDPLRRRAAHARALDAFDRVHRRGIGAAIARHFVRSSAPAWRLITDTLDNPAWNDALVATWLRMFTSALALVLFAGALIAALMVSG
jgi:hypothetical protein